jgi:hypothetical protein
MGKFLSFRDIKKLSKIKGHNLMSTSDAADKYGLTRQYVNWMLRNDMIPGAFRVAREWLIPAGWKYKPSREGGKHGPQSESTLALDNPDKILDTWKVLKKLNPDLKEP